MQKRKYNQVTYFIIYDLHLGVLIIQKHPKIVLSIIVDLNFENSLLSLFK